MNLPIDNDCPKCHGFGEIIICGWCQSNMPHSSCDDTFNQYCECEAGIEFKRQDRENTRQVFEQLGIIQRVKS